VHLPWLAHDEAPGTYITIPQYWFNKTKQHTHTQSTWVSRKNCLMCPKSSVNNSPTLVLYKLVGSGMKENCRCVDSWTVLKGSTGQGRVRLVVEVLGIHILQLDNFKIAVWSATHDIKYSHSWLGPRFTE